MNIYEAVVYCRICLLNAPVISAHNDANTFDRQLNSTNGRSSTKIILFHFMMEPHVK